MNRFVTSKSRSPTLRSKMAFHRIMSFTTKTMDEDDKVLTGLNGYQYDTSGKLFGSSHLTVKPHSATAFEYKLASLEYIETARNWPGNIFFHVTRDRNNPLTYRWFECWQDITSVAGFVYKFSKPKIFDTEEVKKMIERGSITVDGTFTELYPSENGIERASEIIEFKLNANINDVWSVLGDWGGCISIPNAVKVESNINGNPMLRRVYFGSDTVAVEPGKGLLGELLIYDTSKAPNEYRLKYQYNETEETIDIGLLREVGMDGVERTIIRGSYNIGKLWPSGSYNENAFEQAKYVFGELIEPHYKKIFEKELESDANAKPNELI